MLRRFIASIALMAAAVLAIGAGSASAELRHTTVTAEFGSDGTAATTFGGIGEIAYQQSNHRIYVLGGGSLYGFNNSSPGVFTELGGNFPLSGFGATSDTDVAVDNSGGGTANRIYYTPDGPSISGFNSVGGTITGWPVDAEGEICGVAVDNQGHVWGGRYPSGGSAVEFGSTGGSAIKSVDVSANPGSPCKVAIDPSNNDLYVSAYGSSGGVVQYTAASGYTESKFIANVGGNSRVAVNGAKHHLYIGPNGGSEVSVFDTTTGNLIEQIPISGGVKGLAVNEATDTLYVAVTGIDRVEEIPAANVPKVSTGESTSNSTVSGIVDPDGGGPITECYFEFKTSESSSYTNTKACTPATLPYTAEQAVTASLPGLLGETTYDYRLVAANASIGGRNVGEEKTITPHNVAGLKTEPATEITKTSAKLNGFFEGNGEDTTYYFEYGTSSEYGTTIPLPPTEEDAGEPTGPAAIAVLATGLNFDTTYHFRVVATNGLGVSPGKDRTFTTLPAVTDLVTGEATNIGPKSATIGGSFSGDGNHTTYFFEYGEDTSYGHTAPISPAEEDAGSPSTPTNLAPVDVAGLSVDTTYHFRVVAKNSIGSTSGNDLTFTTLPAVAGVQTAPASDISQDSVTLNGQFSGNGEDTHYYFEWGPTTGYGHVTDVPGGADAGSPVGPTPVTTKITDFEGYSTYHYRIIAVNSVGTTNGPDMTFTTLASPSPAIESESVSDVDATGATLKAEINPNRWATSYLFEYGPSTAYGSSTPVSGVIAGDNNSGHPVAVPLSGLTPGTTYHFRAVAINFNGTTHGADGSFTTPDVPHVGSSSSSNVTETTALLVAQVLPNYSPTKVHFEYGSSVAYGKTTSEGGSIGADAFDHEVGAEVSGLAPGTTYHFRAVAENAVGSTNGPDQTVTTLPAPVVEPGAGMPPKSCRKGFVRHRGRCVKRRPRHKPKHPHRRPGESG